MQSQIEYMVLLVINCDQLERLNGIVCEFSPFLSATLRLVPDTQASDRNSGRWFKFALAPIWTGNPELGISGISLELRDNQHGSVEVRYLVKDSEAAFAILLRDVEVDQRVLSLRVQCRRQMLTGTQSQQGLFPECFKGGIDLTDLKVEDIGVFEPEQHQNLFFENIKFYAQTLLKADAIEVRLLEKDGVLTPLYNYGMTVAAAERPLFGHLNWNSITGYVAFWSCSYLCVDPESDPLYLEGIQNARSAMTVPIVRDEKTIGTLNVERVSQERYAYADLKLLELFANAIATGLNQLEILDVQRQLAADDAFRLYNEEISLAVDAVLLNTLHALECSGDRDTAVDEILRNTLTAARSLRNSLRECDRRLSEKNKVEHMKFRQRSAEKVLLYQRFLVVDGDEKVRRSAHQLLGPLGGIVETAITGKEAVMMVKSLEHGCSYDAIICAKHLSDVNFLQLMLELQTLVNPLPFVVAFDYRAYDRSSLIVKARMAGLKPGATTLVPFRLQNLLNAIDAAKK